MEDTTVLARISLTQWGIAGGGLVLLLFILVLNCCLKNRRWRAVQEARSGLVSAEFLTLRDLPKSAYELLAVEAASERRTKIVPEWRDDCGWGRPASENAGMHFRTFIATSVHILEAHALRRDAALRACAARASAADDLSCSQLACDVADFLRRLRDATAGELDDDLCAQYLAFYRNARTPGRECTESEYRSFLGVFQEILRRVGGERRRVKSRKSPHLASSSSAAAAPAAPSPLSAASPPTTPLRSRHRQPPPFSLRKERSRRAASASVSSPRDR